ncbi:MAG: cytochrome c oxidase assembly protein [Hyphomicrobiaceae bacterium]
MTMETVSSNVMKREQIGRHRKVAFWTASIALSMLGLAFASVPLYQIFCQVTGFAGTTQRASTPPQQILNQVVTVRFDSNVASGLGWSFRAETGTMDVKIGENKLAFYKATNRGAEAQIGTATFNVTPEAAGKYFNKIECFCFTEQKIDAGETVEMPVSFFLDPEFATDRDTRHITQVTLSYTFYPSAASETETGRGAAQQQAGENFHQIRPDSELRAGNGRI